MDADIGTVGADRDSAFISGFLMCIRLIIGHIFILHINPPAYQVPAYISSLEEIRLTVHRIGPTAPVLTAIIRV
jgi:hypothetical protein